MSICYNEQLGFSDSELLGQMLTNPASTSVGVAERVAGILSNYLIRTTLSFCPSHISVLAADAEGLGEQILHGGDFKPPMGLYVDWLETQRIGGGMYLSRIKMNFRENHPNLLTALAILDPLPFDYEPLSRRMLDHLEKLGLDRILMIAGVISEDWIRQLGLDIDSENAAELRLQALAIVPEDFDLTPFREAIEPWLRKPMAKKFPDIVRNRMY